MCSVRKDIHEEEEEGGGGGGGRGGGGGGGGEGKGGKEEEDKLNKRVRGNRDCERGRVCILYLWGDGLTESGRGSSNFISNIWTAMAT